MLKIRDLTIKFGGLTAVDSLDLDIATGQIFGLIGPNGAGKTTCFNMISGLLAPTRGTIELFREHIEGLPMFKINRKGIARTYQNINLFKEMTVIDNVITGEHTKLHSGLLASILHLSVQKKEEKDAFQRASDILEFVGLKDRCFDHATNLSYGEQRLLEIARALASEPKLLLLDEPAAGMNISEKNDLMELIKKIRDKGITLLIVEHDMKFVMQLTDEICVLNYGKKIACGIPSDIQKSQEVIEAYLGGD